MLVLMSETLSSRGDAVWVWSASGNYGCSMMRSSRARHSFGSQKRHFPPREGSLFPVWGVSPGIPKWARSFLCLFISVRAPCFFLYRDTSSWRQVSHSVRFLGLVRPLPARLLYAPFWIAEGASWRATSTFPECTRHPVLSGQRVHARRARFSSVLEGCLRKEAMSSAHGAQYYHAIFFLLDC